MSRYQRICAHLRVSVVVSVMFVVKVMRSLAGVERSGDGRPFVTRQETRT